MKKCIEKIKLNDYLECSRYPSSDPKKKVGGKVIGIGTSWILCSLLAGEYDRWFCVCDKYSARCYGSLNIAYNKREIEASNCFFWISLDRIKNLNKERIEIEKIIK